MKAALCCLPIRALVLYVIVVCGSVCAAAPTEKAIAEFGQLPSRFNGRIATIDTAARNVLHKLSGREVYFDSEAKQNSAIEWLLEEAAWAGKPPAGAKILRIENRELLKFLGLDARLDMGPLQHRYSLEELEPAFGRLGQVEPQQAEAFGSSLNELVESLQFYIAWRRSLESPAGAEVEQLKEAMSRVQSLDSASVPLLVPPKNSRSGWTLWSRAVLENTILTALKPTDAEPIPAVPYLQAIFTAYRSGESDRLGQAVAAYADLLKLSPPAPAALEYLVPPGWQELGVSVVNGATYFDDTLVAGAAVSRFGTSGGDRSCVPQLLYFPTATASVERIVNHWRMQSGLAPLDAESVLKSLTPVRLGTVDGYTADLVESDNLRQPQRRILATIFRRANDTLVLMAFGSADAVESERANYTRFVQSLKWGTPENCAAWFDLRELNSPLSPAGQAVVVVTDSNGPQPWCFVVRGFGPLSEASRAAIHRFVELFCATRATNVGALKDWNAPIGWRKATTTDEPLAFEHGEANEYRLLTATPLAGFTPAAELPLFNEWRSALRLSPWNAEEATSNVKSVTLKTGPVRTVEFVAPAEPTKPK